MAIKQFSVQDERGIRWAKCENVPTIMVLTGPNGCGKSTLLHQLHRQNHNREDLNVIYLAPHRATRRQNIRASSLLGASIRISQVQNKPKLPTIDGIRVTSNLRDAWDLDEAGSFLKYALAQIEFARREALTKYFDSNSEIRKGDIPDIWEPLRKLTKTLLPHLDFCEIDLSDQNNVKCVWTVHEKEIVVDIDELSSGEKAIIQLFFPFVEARIHAILNQIKEGSAKAAGKALSVIVDEPELHLHPAIQGKVLHYIRGIASEENVQFLLATQSPVIVEQANSEELYLLKPRENVSVEENQLVRVASDDEKLSLMREIFRSTANLTALRPLVLIEGRGEEGARKNPTDQRIYRFLDERFNNLSLIPCGGKGECIRTMKKLRELMSEIDRDLKVYSLVDADLDAESTYEGVRSLPVSMVENFLVDPKVIFVGLETVRHKIGFESLEQVERSLNSVLDELESDEINRRAKSKLGAFKEIRISRLERASEELEEYIKELRDKVAKLNVESCVDEATQEVEKIKKQGARREHFDGKRIMNIFYENHVKGTGMSKEIFVNGCARAAKERKKVREFMENFFRQIDIK